MPHWLEEINGLGSAPLTVQSQALPFEEQDRFTFPVFFPFDDVNSVKVATLTTVDKRYVADFREWNQRGRFIPVHLPSVEELEMVPIESYDKIGEREIQELRERTLGTNAEIYRAQIAESVPDRVNTLTLANWRRVEMAAMEAWSKGTITVMNPATGTTYVLSLNFGSRIATAGTAWDVATSAYDEFITWAEDGEQQVGAFSGAVTTRKVLKAIQDDAPNPVPGASTVRVGLDALEGFIADQLGMASFTFFIMEHSYDTFDDAGTAHTRTKVWPAGYISLVNEGVSVGSTKRAPVARAMDLAETFPDAKIDIRGMVVFYETEGNGRVAVLECQANHLPLPQKEKVWSINTLVV